MINDFEFLDLETDLLEQVEIEQLTDYEDDIIEESNIDSSDVGAPKNKGNVRYIMITGSGDSSHQGRMKVSKPGVRISRNSSHDEYISIYRKSENKNLIEYDGDLKKIDMKNKEYNFYEDLFIRNENLIQLVKTGKGKYDSYVDDALVSDEQRRSSGLTVTRDDKGNASIYDKNGNLLYKENIKGERI